MAKPIQVGDYVATKQRKRGYPSQYRVKQFLPDGQTAVCEYTGYFQGGRTHYGRHYDVHMRLADLIHWPY